MFSAVDGSDMTPWACLSQHVSWIGLGSYWLYDVSEQPSDSGTMVQNLNGLDLNQL